MRGRRSMRGSTGTVRRGLEREKLNGYKGLEDMIKGVDRETRERRASGRRICILLALFS